ncbi:MAG: YidE/YbjL duplication, partial [Treponema sp.]|nr:YidE/YbjL duplication [Treponema sp.]
MLTYLAGLCSSTLSVIFIIFIIGALGFMLGGINVKGISLGTAGVLIVALAYGILIHYFPEFSIEAKKITLWSNSIKSSFSLISNIGTALFVTAVG